MSKKIVITGGLGYIGTELCKIYSGESWKNQITVIDNRFVSERVNQLRNWSINFVHADVRNKEEVKHFLNEADVIHHLAGITDVARTKEELSPDFQTAEFVEKHGFVDLVVNRKDLKDQIATLLSILLKKNSDVNSEITNETPENIASITKAAS